MKILKLIIVLITPLLLGCNEESSSLKDEPHFINYFPNSGIEFSGHVLGQKIELKKITSTNNKKEFKYTSGNMEYIYTSFLGSSWFVFDLNKTGSALVLSGLDKGRIKAIPEADFLYSSRLVLSECMKNKECIKKETNKIYEKPMPFTIYEIGAVGVLEGELDDVSNKFTTLLKGFDLNLKLTEHIPNESYTYAFIKEDYIYTLTVFKYKESDSFVNVDLELTYLSEQEDSTNSRLKKNANQVNIALENYLTKKYDKL